ncbi:MAG: DUF695 domain-containing protein, partial [Planctomycetaceae bacterium]|nr:DUF695 domain-containing protein [Planctomycetaceae bacterium]
MDMPNGKELQDQQISQYDQDWDSYMNNVNNTIGSFFIDLGLAKIAPVADKSNLVWIDVTMQNPRENGLSDDAERDLLFEIEDEIVNNIFKKHNAIFAGRLTSAGLRTLYFYLEDISTFESTFAQSMAKYPSYKYEFGCKEDKDWEIYFNFLYPTPEQYQIIMNLKVIRTLEKYGDNLTSERMVDHWIYFQNEVDMENYVSEVSENSFQVLDKNKTDKT